MIQVQEQVSLRRQCELLAIGRSGLHYEPVGTSAEELSLMRRIDQIHLKWPFYVARKLCETLRAEDTTVNRKRMKRIMRVMGLESVAPKPDTSEPHAEHPVFPYLLRNLSICRTNHVWTADISTSRWLTASPIWWPSSTGTAAAYSRGGCPTPWSKLLLGGAPRGTGAVPEARDFQHRPGLAVHVGRLYRRAAQRRYHHQHDELGVAIGGGSVVFNRPKQRSRP
jgi:hypothetical protein